MNKYYLLKLYNGRNTVINECEVGSKKDAIKLFQNIHKDFLLDDTGYAQTFSASDGLHVTYCVAGHFNNK